MKTRIYFLDNLRTLMIFLVVVLHTGIVYEPILENTWIVSNPDKVNSLGLVRMYLDLFVMFTIFFISGYFISNSLNSKTSWGFIKSKFKRIMLPWLVAVFTLIPAYKVIFLYSRGLAQEEWYTYFHLFQRTGSDLSFFANNPTQNWLWFLPVLFVFQVMYLVLAKTNLLSIKISIKTGVILTFVIGLAYSMFISGLELRGWFHSPLLHFQRERLLVYFMVFLLGSLCNKLNVFESDIKNRKYYLWSNVSLSVSLSIFTIVALNLFFNMIEPGRDYYFISMIADRVAYYATMLLSMLSFLYIFIYAFKFKLNRTNRIMSVMNNNSYAVYIIHLVVIGVIALALLNIKIPAIVKFIIVTVLSFVVSNVLVSTYRKLIKQHLSFRLIRVAIPMLAIVLSVIIYVKQAESAKAEDLQNTSQKLVTPPAKSIHAAAVEGNLTVIQQHIEAGTDLNVKEPSGGSSPLITASVFGKTEVAVALIDAGADVNFRNNEGSTALHSAAFFCHIEIVEALLENGVDKSIQNNNESTALQSVEGPLEEVKGFYKYFENTLGPLGLELDYEQIEKNRPKIAEMLK